MHWVKVDGTKLLKVIGYMLLNRSTTKKYISGSVVLSFFLSKSQVMLVKVHYHERRRHMWQSRTNSTSHELYTWFYCDLSCITSSCEFVFTHPLGLHDDVIKLEHLLRYWPFVRGTHPSPVNSPHKGQYSGVWCFSLICAWTNFWINNRDAGELRRHHTHYEVTVMGQGCIIKSGAIRLHLCMRFLLPGKTVFKFWKLYSFEQDR